MKNIPTFKNYSINENGEVWMDMIKSRSLTSHTYNEEIAEKIVQDIVQKYFHEFSLLETKMKFLKEKKL